MKRTDIPEEPDLCRQALSLFLSFLVCLILLKCELSVSKPPPLLSHFLFPTPPWSCFRIKRSGLDVPTGTRPATTLSPGLWPRTCPQQLPVSPWKRLALGCGVDPPCSLGRQTTPSRVLLFPLVCRQNPTQGASCGPPDCDLGGFLFPQEALSSSLTSSQKTSKTRSAGRLPSTTLLLASRCA